LCLVGTAARKNPFIKISTSRKSKAARQYKLTFAQQDETHPVWSPDGNYIAFCRMINVQTPFQRFGIYIVPAAGGEPRKIAEGGEGVSWSPDGKVLALAGLPSDSGGIFLAALATGERTQVTRPSQYTDEYPVFSPDGQWIAFSRSVDRSEGSFSSCGWVRQMHGNLHSTTALFMARPGQPTARRSPFRQTVQAEARACGASP
jgi:Tol biopolymer transport system component